MNCKLLLNIYTIQDQITIIIGYFIYSFGLKFEIFYLDTRIILLS